MKAYEENIIGYIHKDYLSPKQSTICLIEFLKKRIPELSLNRTKEDNNLQTFVDLGSGGCSGLYPIAKEFEKFEFIGLDYNRKIIDWVNDFWASENGKKFNLPNLSAEYADWNLPETVNKILKKNNVLVLLAIHSLCTVKNLSKVLTPILKHKPKHLVFNSLFYDGPLDAFIHIKDYNIEIDDNNPDADFNIHSIPRFRNFLEKLGYKNFYFEPFDIGFNLPRPFDNGRGTYTINTEFSKYSQFSGPVYLPWYFVHAEKK